MWAHGIGSLRHWRQGAALLAGCSTAYALDACCSNLARCDREEPAADVHAEALGAARLQAFRTWLLARGCELDTVSIQPCAENPQAGLAIYLTDKAADRLRPPLWRRPLGWLLGRRDAVLASFPLAGVVSAKALLADPQLGRIYADLLEKGAEERDLVMLFLLTERLKGPRSAWQPWLACLPQAFSTPLFAPEALLAELQGTPLEQATKALRWRLWQSWQLLAPAVDPLLQAAGCEAAGSRATFDDLLWAHAVYWSRSIAFPDPGEAGGAEPNEGLVPGLDCCNHAPDAAVRWSVWNAASAKGRRPTAVALVAPPHASLAPGQEARISYGDKGNEELLLQYGFTVDGNPDDALMLRCPVPDESAASLAAKQALLQARGLRPQLFLTAGELARAQAAGGDASLALGERVWELLEVLTLPPGAAVAAAASVSSLSEAELAHTRLFLTGLSPAERCERALARLRLLRTMLASELAELEQGTGPLEQDVRMLEAADAGTPPLLRSCVVYRASLKRLARGFLAAAEVAIAAEEQTRAQLLAKQQQQA